MYYGIIFIWFFGLLGERLFVFLVVLEMCGLV